MLQWLGLLLLPDNKIYQHRAKYISGRPTVNIQQKTYSSVSGQDVTISCVVSSNPTASISWIFISTGNSQTQITTSNAKYSLTTSSGGSSLVVRNSNSGDSGTYRCTATNTVGSASDSASLTVSGSRSHRVLEQNSNYISVYFPWGFISLVKEHRCDLISK